MLRQIETSHIASLDDPFWVVWRRVKPMVAKALGRADEYSLGDVLHYVNTGKWQLWQGDNSVAFTRIASYPEHSACIIVLSAGDLNEIKALEPGICTWAKRMGCKYVEIFGRRGWQKALPGYKEQHTVLRKGLS